MPGQEERRSSGAQTILPRASLGAWTDISVYCLQAGLALLRSQEYETPPLMYLSTTDFVQHKWAPGDAEANEFYSKIDAVFGELDSEGAVVGLTADHGMNAKASPVVRRPCFCPLCPLSMPGART